MSFRFECGRQDGWGKMEGDDWLLHDDRVCRNLPVELIRQRSLPNLMCTMENSAAVERTHSMFLKMCTIPKRNVKEWNRMEVGSKVFYHCEVYPACNAFYTMEYDSIYRYGGAFVSSRFTCNCARKAIDSFDHTWKDLLEKKYEHCLYALDAVIAFYFAKLCYVPVDARLSLNDDDELIGKITYHKISEDLPMQVMTFVIHQRPDLGYNIMDPLDLKHPVLKKTCIVCKCVNTEQDLLNGRYVQMFGQSCKMHAVCEGCISEYWLSKNVGASPTRGCTVFYNTVKKQCRLCNLELENIVEIALPGITCLHVAAPLCWYNNKAVVSSSFKNSTIQFYLENIDWLVQAIHKYNASFQNLKDKYETQDIAVEEYKGSLEEKQKLQSERYKTWRQIEETKKMMVFLMEKKRHISWVFNPSEVFPDEFLRLDHIYYAAFLDKNEYMTLEKRLEV